MIAPVSVCHQVSTTGVRSPPITRRYQTQASGLIGSPTEPSRRSEDRSYRPGSSSPHFITVRMAVGAVYRIVTPYFCTISHQRPRRSEEHTSELQTRGHPVSRLLPANKNSPQLLSQIEITSQCLTRTF